MAGELSRLVANYFSFKAVTSDDIDEHLNYVE